MMLLLVVISSMLAVAAADVSYSSNQPSGPSFSYGGGSFGGGGYSGGGGSCGPGQVRHVDGSCVTPRVTRNLYLFRAPDVGPSFRPRPILPPPRIEKNIVFIHTPEDLIDQQPVVVPPPQQKNVVYLLNKRPELDQQVIHVPAPEQEAPEIFFVNYADGENPNLPTGGDLQYALRKASQGSGEVVNGGGSIGGTYSNPSPPTRYGEY